LGSEKTARPFVLRWRTDFMLEEFTGVSAFFAFHGGWSVPFASLRFLPWNSHCHPGASRVSTQFSLKAAHAQENNDQTVATGRPKITESEATAKITPRQPAERS
jgi:hypothetical protein